MLSVAVEPREAASASGAKDRALSVQLRQRHRRPASGR